jgi:hypothetical protein
MGDVQTVSGGEQQTLTRRVFLARTGVLGMAVSAGILVPVKANAILPLPLPDLVKLLRPALAELARDTFNGLTVFVVPGPDAYSTAQGTPQSEPGALEAKATDFMLESLDNFVPFPEQLAAPTAAALQTAMADLGIELPADLLGLSAPAVATLDDALGALIEGGATIPLSLTVALLLNLVATQVNPAAVSGPFLSPFARLSFAEKAKAFELIEGPNADLVAALDVNLPEPLRGSVSGLLKFVGGALLEFAGFGAYNEHAVFDRETKTLTARPVGWTLSDYEGVSDGWDEFLGYYQDRTEVENV